MSRANRPQVAESGRATKWCCWGGLNSRPHPYQGCALPLSYSGDPAPPAKHADTAPGPRRAEREGYPPPTGRQPPAGGGGAGAPVCQRVREPEVAETSRLCPPAPSSGAPRHAAGAAIARREPDPGPATKIAVSITSPPARRHPSPPIALLTRCPALDAGMPPASMPLFKSTPAMGRPRPKLSCAHDMLRTAGLRRRIAQGAGR